MISSFFLKGQTYVILLMTIQYIGVIVFLEIILEDLQHGMKILLNWFKIHSMNTNPRTF